MSDVPYTNGRKDYQRILLSVIAAAWSVILIAGTAWVGSIQSQFNAAQNLNASLGVNLARFETQLTFLGRDLADLRIKVNELERTVPRLRPDR